MKIREEIYHYHANIIFLFKNINIDINKLLAYYTDVCESNNFVF